MFEIQLAPLSQNMAWAGKRYKTADYKQYEKKLMGHFKTLDLPKILQKEKFCVYYEWSITNRVDNSNCVKLFEDILCKYLQVNDRDVLAFYSRKKVVKKIDSNIKFAIFPSEYDLIQFLQKEV